MEDTDAERVVQMNEHTKEVREHLQMQLENSAEWRARKAEEYSEDTRNAQCAVALALAARDLVALPDNDPRLLHLAQFWEESDDDATGLYIAEEHLIISRHGFDSPEATTEGLLEAIANAADEATLRSIDRLLPEDNGD